VVTLNPMRSPLGFSVVFSWLALLVASFVLEWDLPIIRDPIQAWLFRFDRTTGTLWEVVSDFPDAIGDGDAQFSDWAAQQRGNLVQLFLVLSVGATLGRLFY
jgi:hypothetical protein